MFNAHSINFVYRDSNIFSIVFFLIKIFLLFKNEKDFMEIISYIRFDTNDKMTDNQPNQMTGYPKVNFCQLTSCNPRFMYRISDSETSIF